MSASLEITLACERVKDKVMSSLNESKSVQLGIIDDPDIATYAAYQEFGWVQRVTAKQARWFRGLGLEHPPVAGMSLVSPPRPFLRGTVKAEANKWARVYEKAFQRYGALNASAALEFLGMVAADDIRQTLINGGTSKEQFDTRSELTQEMYGLQSKGHETDGSGMLDTDKPLVKTGALLNAIGFQISNN